MDYSKILRLVGINLAILLVYVAAIFAISSWGAQNEEALVYMIFTMMAVGIHSLVCLIIAIYFFIVQKNEIGVAFILSLLLVGIIGFSACMGGVYLEPGVF
jgi:hypothetical protein